MQDFVALLIVAAAAAFLARRAWQRAARRAGCSACTSCSGSAAANPHGLVTISPLVPHAEAQNRQSADG
jgi:hypothetical protein